MSDNGYSTDAFFDVHPVDWFYDGIMYLFTQKIVIGYGDGTFRPYGGINCGEMAAVIVRTLERDIETPDIEEFTEVFPHPDFIEDGHLHWSAGPVWTARDYFIEKNFSPEDRLTRQVMAYTAVKMYEGYDEDNVNLSILDRFEDKDLIGEQYKKPLAYLVSIGVLNGSLEDGRIYLNPLNECTRAETGVFLARVLQGLDKSKMKEYKDAVDYVKSAGGEQS